MVKVTYREFGGTEHVVDVPAGRTLMEGAVSTSTPGILGECGGSMACGTCHVYVDPPWDVRVGTKSHLEAGMLETVLYTQPNSRLACQIRVTDELDGLVVCTPKSQY
jgi:2Fe-2S ferredoxin